MQGAGNDFIIIDNVKEKIPADKFAALAKCLCHRRLSIGADGMMIVESPKSGGDFSMIFYNSDGSIGEMCGNGARCIARYGYEHGLSKGDTQTIETTSGVVVGHRESKTLYTVRLSDPTVVKLSVDAEINGTVYNGSYVELGSPGLPHGIFIMDGWQDIPESDLRELGRSLRYYKDFPKGANITFCKITDTDSVVAKTFERGVEDFTLACGTGCGSTVTALTLRGLVSGKNVKVSMPGGDLFVTVTQDGDTAHDIQLTGPTDLVCVGEVLDDALQSVL
jgi:diaminopimelate epimerase